MREGVREGVREGGSKGGNGRGEGCSGANYRKQRRSGLTVDAGVGDVFLMIGKQTNKQVQQTNKQEN